jgi:RNA polymerase sigma-70 factor (ECF subfamily)
MVASEVSDELLLLSGDAEDFGLLYARRHALIRGYLRRRIGSQPDVVLDLVAETFARALERREQFDPRRGSAIGWLLTIARNLLSDAVRRGRVADDSRRRLGMERMALDDAQLEAIERNGLSDLERLLGALPQEQRRAVEGRVLNDEPYATIALQIGCSEQVIRKRVSRGLAVLRRNVEESS